MRKTLYWLLLLAPVPAFAQNYSAALIPDSLRKGARVVVREDDHVVEIRSPGKAIERENEVYTVLNSSGDNLGGYRLDYDKFTTVNEASGILFDSLGKVVRKMKKKDMQDRSYVDESSLATDDRYLQFDFYCQTYPYTVDYQKEIQHDGIRDFDDWLPLMNAGISTQHSKYTVIAPKDYNLRYLLLNGAPAPVITEEKDKKIYTWEAKNLPARHREAHGPRWREVEPYVLIGPSEFELEGYKGNMSTWLDYGKFVGQLWAGRDVLPDNVKQQVHSLTDSITDARRKVYVLYRFLQQNTHYINVSLGIGGLQTFPATYVATKKYGDCKALSNYMVALLKEAGVPARYVIVRAEGDAPPMVEAFPSLNQFNHVIVCVPLARDSIWLECTSQTESPGYMGTFTGGRQALLIDADGGHVVWTPSYTARDNTQIRTVKAQIGPDGNLDADVSTEYRCVSSELPHGMMDELTGEQREKYLNELFYLPTYKVEASHYTELQGPRPTVKEDLHVVALNYASVSGRRLFIAPNVFDRSRTRLPADSVRKFDYITRDSHTDIDSAVISVPPGYRPEAMPRDMDIQGRFGRFRSSVHFEGDKLVYYRYLQQTAGSYPPSEYAGLVKFYEQLYQSDNQRVVLVKKE
ncbi:MAG TPA: DUF3857 domain-containing protein [Puia sp.]|nr:DUF3857 domain-containing protein [Puia sp.]